MKQLLLLMFVFLNVACSAQKVKIGPEIATCESGKEKAISDFNKDHYEVYIFGMIDMSKDDGFDKFYKDYLLQKYSITLMHKGDILMPDSKCYSDKMELLLSKKFGEDFFEVAKKEARVEFEKTRD